MPRFYIPKNLTANLLNNVSVSLPDKVARHVQVLRYQPEDVIDLFDGSGMVYQAEIIAMGKKMLTYSCATVNQYQLNQS